jgi:Arm DNA-binding domain
MTKRSLLTDASIRSRQKKPGYYLDGHGLYLQVNPGGSRSWILRFTLNKRVREMGLGSADDFGLAQARERARRARELVADGIDPIDRRKSDKKAQDTMRQAEQASRKTFEDCAVEFHEANADEWRNDKHSAQWINTLRTYAFPTFGRTPVGEVSKSDIVKSVLPIWKSKAETAGRVLQRIRTVLNYSAAKDYCVGRDAEFWEQTRLGKV